MAHLCNYCRQIPFRQLSCPTAADILRARQARQNGGSNPLVLPFPDSLENDDTGGAKELDRTPLGTIGRIHTSSQSCALCRLIYTAIEYRGARWLTTFEDEKIIVEASHGARYFAKVTDSLRDAGYRCPDAYLKLRRLAISVIAKDDVEVGSSLIQKGKTLAFYNEVAQACQLDVFETTGSNDTEASEHAERMLFGGRVRPETVDFSLLRKWMDTCVTAHDRTCFYNESSQDNTHRTRLIRFVDTKKNCIRIFRDIYLRDIQYAALSYVWGKAKQYKLEESNETQIQADNSLLHVNIPQTIKDSIYLAQVLNIGFLLVDVLCIRQGQSEGDINDRKYQLSNMGNIYRDAHVAIAAACGDDADSGLSGLRPGSRKAEQQVVEVIPKIEDPKGTGLALVSTCSSRPGWSSGGVELDPDGADVDASVWSTRAWTFQERFLSRRCLIFTKEQVYWVCDGAVFCEESSFEHPDIFERTEQQTPLRLEMFMFLNHGGILAFKTIDGPLSRHALNRERLWTNFCQSLEAYSRRSLSFPGDIYDAFEGVLKAYGEVLGETFQWGHPRSRFVLSLLWDSGGSGYYHGLHRRTDKTTLPMTHLNERVMLPSWSWMGWNGVIFMPLRDEWLEAESFMISCYEHISSPLRIAPIAPETNNDSLNHVANDAIEPSWVNIQKVDVTLTDIQKHYPMLTESKLQRIPSGYILFFWASSAILSVEKPADFRLAGPCPSLKASRKPEVRDGTGRCVGTLNRMNKKHWDSFPDSSDCEEFIAICRRDLPVPDFVPIVMALQIRWSDGIAERVNIAEIEEPAWIKANPVWKLVALM